jgi:adenine-specific DNA-methyltransferase
MPTLDWLDRQTAFSVANKTATHVLRPHAAGHVFGDAAAARDNLLIQGDNLQALKALLPFYRGQVKCIFIDPPYNTKSAFEHYDDNLEHSKWLSMMLPRLQVLRDLLREDGSIWVTIDDNEGHYLKVMMDEVFGRGNFVANVFWEKKFSPQNDAHQLSINHDHLLVYGVSRDSWRPNLLPRSEKQASNFKNPDNDPRGHWLSADYTCAKSKDERPNLYYPIKNPFTQEEVWPSPTRVWAFDRSSTELNVKGNLLYWGQNGTNERPRLKKFPDALQQGTVPTTFWRHDEVGNNQEAKKEILTFDALAPFATPKPERLLQRVLHLATNPGDLVLDSFLGSGTTAAVAHKMGRRWIGIEMGEHATTHCTPRLQKVIDGEQGGISTTVGWQGGGGFQLLQLGAPLFDEQGDIHPEVRFADLAAFIWMRETGTALPAPAASGPLPLLGVHEGTAYYLLFNGILGDRRPASGNVLTTAVLQALNELCGHDGPKVIYGEACRLGDARLKAEGISFKQLPHAVPH